MTLNKILFLICKLVRCGAYSPFKIICVRQHIKLNGDFLNIVKY